jgi:hypothetical protein
MPRDDGSDTGSFISGISFDVTGDRAAVLAAVGETRDVFESLGSSSRIWTIANGEYTGRLTITNEFEGIAGWARFRAKLDEYTAAGNALPMAQAAGNFQGAGIAQSTEIDL